jgi:hypothetical protein
MPLDVNNDTPRIISTNTNAPDIATDGPTDAPDITPDPPDPPDVTPPLPDANTAVTGPETAGPIDTSNLAPPLSPLQQRSLDQRIPAPIQAILGGMCAGIADGKPVDNAFIGPHVFVQVAAQDLFSVRFRDLNEDNDGDTPDSIRRQDPTSQRTTSFTQANGRALNSVDVPYYVEPLGPFRSNMGTGQGDIAAFLRPMPNGDVNLAFAICGDLGPRNKWGEGSIALHRALGHNPIDANGRLHDSAITVLNNGAPGLVAIVFEGSAAKINALKAQGQALTEANIYALGMDLFRAQGGAPDNAIRPQDPGA